MVRFLLRSAGFVCCAAAFAAIVVDGTRSLAAGQLLMAPLSEAAAWLLPARFEGASHAVAALAVPALRDAILAAFAAPVFAILAILGALFIVLGRKPAPRIGFSSRRR